MIRIVGVQRSERANSEFVLLQNQGSLRINLRGHALISDSVLDSGDMWSAAFVLGIDEVIRPGQYVVVYTGHGEARSTVNKEGVSVMYVYLGRSLPVWADQSAPIHILHTQHSYIERPTALVLS